MTSTTPDGRVQFRFYRPQASTVSVVGNFNAWRPDELSMTPVGDGWWLAEIELPDGEYQFRYVADGQWYTDFAAHGVEVGRHGYNSLLIVGTPAISLAA